MTTILTIIIGSIFVNNYVFAKFLGICPLLGVSAKVETSIGMGMAVTFVITLASVFTYILSVYVLEPLSVLYLQTIVFILVIASLVQFVEMFMKKSSPALYSALGVFLPLITTNCVVLGVAVINIDSGYNLIETLANAIGSSIGFCIAIVLLASLREKIVISPIPKAFQGFPIAMISTGLMAVAFMGFNGMIK